MQEPHNSLEQISSWIPSCTDGLLGGAGRHTFWHLPSSLQRRRNPCQNQELFHPNFLGALLFPVPWACWIRNIFVYLSLFSPFLPQIMALFKDGGGGVFFFLIQLCIPRAPAEQQALCRCSIIFVKWKDFTKVAFKIEQPWPNEGIYSEKHYSKYTMIYVQRCSLQWCFNIKNCTQFKYSPVGNY